MTDFVNGGFETYDTTGWSVGGASYYVTEGEKHSGLRSLFMGTSRWGSTTWCSQVVDLTDVKYISCFFKVYSDPSVIKIYVGEDVVYNQTLTSTSFTHIVSSLLDYTGEHTVKFEISETGGLYAQGHLDDCTLLSGLVNGDFGLEDLTGWDTEVSDSNNTSVAYYGGKCYLLAWGTDEFNNNWSKLSQEVDLTDKPGLVFDWEVLSGDFETYHEGLFTVEILCYDTEDEYVVFQRYVTLSGNSNTGESIDISGYEFTGICKITFKILFPIGAM